MFRQRGANLLEFFQDIGIQVQQYIDQHVGLVFLCSKKTPWEWNYGAETCRILIFDMIVVY